MRRESLKRLVEAGLIRGSRGRKILGTVLLVGVSGLALRNAEVLSREQARHPEHRLEIRTPVSLYQRFRDSRFGGARERFAFYQLAARFEGARVWLPRRLQWHAWNLERVSRVTVEIAPGALTISERTAEELSASADFTGRLGDRNVYFKSDQGTEYVLAEVGETGPLFWISRRHLEP